jgi:hypothetical protein
MKPIDELRVSPDTSGFLADLRSALGSEDDEECDYSELRERCFGESPDDTLEWGLSEGRTQLANELRAIFTKHGVSL